MKLQNLAVIFICIALPLSMILSTYTQSRVQTLELQTSYDVKLDNATADAVTAFQINTYNGDESILANYKMENIEAAVNTFYNSMRTNFAMGGYNNKAIEEFIPAIVFILYDGYYIYSPYQNTWDQETIDGTNRFEDEGGLPTYNGGTASDNNRESLFGLKPYVYYSCRYKRGSTDVVITYSLDNYVSIKGMAGNEVIDKSGYLLSDVQKNNNVITYRGNVINTETNYTERVVVDGQVLDLPCRKINGTKYYYNPTTGETFHFFNSQKTTDNGLTFSITDNSNAIEYYEQALDLRDYINSHPDLKNLTTADALDEEGNDLIEEFGNYKIFDELFNGTIENEDSLFNSHRLSVIKYSVERNLSIAVTNYNNYSSASVNFRMPELMDYEWDEISNNISIISFLQGLPIGAKVYNGYSIVTNNKNQELVSEDSIYILASDGIYHDIKDENLYNGNVNISGAKGYYNINFERKSGFDSTGKRIYYFPVENVTGCYDCIVNKRNLSDSQISDLLNGNSELARIYYTALGRERYGLYRPANNTNFSSTSGDPGGGAGSQNNLQISATVNYNDIQSEATINLTITGDDSDIATISYDNVPGITKVNDKTYRCTQNGTYTFTVRSADGTQTVSRTVQINGIYSNADFIRYNVQPGDYIRYVSPSNSVTILSGDSGYNSTQVINTTSYNSGYWRVLYNNDEYGLQIVSDINIAGDTGLYLGGQRGYNNSVSILNNIASQFVDSNYAEWGRALGTNPADPFNDTAGTVDLLWGGSSGCKDYDNNYRPDLTQLRSYGMIRDSMDTWLASRTYDAEYDSGNNIGYHRWSVRAFSATGNEENKLIFEQNWNSGDNQTSENAGVRPVIKLKDGIQIISGNGTMSNPYVISY